MKRLASAIALLILPLVAFAQYDDPEVQAAIAKCPQAAAFVRAHPSKAVASVASTTPPSLPTLRDELLRMEQQDQQARTGGFDEAQIKRMLAVDAANLPAIKRIVEQHGFPTPAMVGADGASAAWILVQHADADPAFQSDVLEQIKPRLQTGELKPQEYALLTDRVLTGQGRAQRYGSQLEVRDGKFAPKPIEDPANVDARRAELGQMPLAAYVCVTAALFGPPPPSPVGRKE